jgi:membrane-bound serine protease (ClpP class)
VRPRTIIWLALLAAGVAALLVPGSGAQSSTTVPSIEFDGTVDPASQKWIESALDDAADDGAPLAIIRIDTPGGLESSMRDIVRSIIEAPMPVVVYVSPDGARAASAGAFITEAADVAAMAPQTNIGSASAVTSSGGDIEGTLGLKIENDAAAFIRALAQAHGRDGDLPGQMVTDAANFTSGEALDGGAIDLVASSEDDLLSQLNGFHVQGPKAQTLDTTGLEIDDRDKPFQYELLSILVNPNVAYLLLLAGLIGIAIELLTPGVILPGTLGVISFVLGAYGTSQLPVTAAGIALLVIGIAFVIAEAHLPTHGILGAVGVISMAISGLLLFDTGSSSFEVSAPLVIGVALALGGLMVLAIKKVVQARRNPTKTGWEEMIGATGDVRRPLAPEGQVFVQGALWRARLAEGAAGANGERVLERGARVRVESVDGLTLYVRPLETTAEEQA